MLTDTFEKSGEGGLDEFKTHLADDQAAYGFLRMTVGNDELSKRSKFVFIIWCGPQVKVMRKAKLSVHIASVKAVLKNFAVELAATAKNEVSEKELTLLLKKAMGANYDRQTSTY
jgi:hypothetical protein